MAAEASTSSSCEVEKRILDMLERQPGGVQDKVLVKELDGVAAPVRATAVNKLLAAGKLELYKQGGGLLYKLARAVVGGGAVSTAKGPAATAIKGANTEEKLVYDIITGAGNKGIWIRHIRSKSNLVTTQLTKVLKSLEGKHMIKAVKSVVAPKQKVYMLYDLEPDQSITGGSWYSDQEFDSEFVDVLNQQCYRYLQDELEKATSGETTGAKSGPIARKKQSFMASEDIWKRISTSGLFTIKLTLDNIEVILDTLVYDGKVEKTMTGSGDKTQKLYRAVESLLPPPGLMYFPCGMCPIIKDCCQSGLVTPYKCQYMNEWLD